MSEIKKWKSTAAGNDDAAPDGFPENMLRSDVNNSAREVMASVRSFWEDPSWKNPVHGYTVVIGDTDKKVKIQGLGTDSGMNLFKNDQKVKLSQSSGGDVYAFIASRATEGADVVLTLEDFDAAAPDDVVPADCDGIEIYFLGGSSGISRQAFESAGAGFENVAIGANAAEINAAIVSASSSGNSVLLPPGTITLTDEIVIPSANSGVRIVGSGVFKTILKRSVADKSVISVATGASNITIENLYIDGDCTNQTTLGHGITFGDNVKQVRLRDLWIVNSWGSAINFGGTASGGGEAYSDIWIESTKIDRCGANGIYVTDANGLSGRIYLSDVSVRSFGDTGDATTSSADACAISVATLAQAEGLVVEAPYSATNHASFAGACIRLDQPGVGGSPPGGRKSHISNFRIEGGMNGVTGLHVRGDGSQISNGWIDLSGSGTVKPIVVNGRGSGAESAQDNTLSNITVVDGTRSEVLGNSDRTILDSCSFTAASETALLVGGDHTKIQNCSFDGQATNTILKAIETQSGSDGIQINGCTIRKTGGDAITIVGDDIKVSGCSFNDITGEGITLTGDDAVIRNNDFTDMTKSGIKVINPSDGARIMGNTFSTLTENGINLLASSTNHRIVGNRFDDTTLQNILDNSTDSTVNPGNSPSMSNAGVVLSGNPATTGLLGSTSHPQSELGGTSSKQFSYEGIFTHPSFGSPGSYLQFYVGDAGNSTDTLVHTSATVSGATPAPVSGTVTYSTDVSAIGKISVYHGRLQGTEICASFSVTNAFRVQDVGE